MKAVCECGIKRTNGQTNKQNNSSRAESFIGANSSSSAYQAVTSICYAENSVLLRYRFASLRNSDNERHCSGFIFIGGILIGHFDLH